MLHSGLTLSAAGVISGTPTETGTNLLDLVVLDNAGKSTNRWMELVIRPIPPP